MRSLAVASLVLAAAAHGTAAADNFLQAQGGIMIPVEDSDWSDYVESGPKLAVRLGGSGGGQNGLMVSADWSPLTEDDDGFSNVDVSAHRFRVLANVYTERSMGPKLVAVVRAGLGIDITKIEASVDLGPLGRTEADDTDAGLALEVAGGLWFQAGGNVQVGGELAFPISFHADDEEDDIDLNDYSSLDVDLLFGVRIQL
jgi:hypothetical protein